MSPTLTLIRSKFFLHLSLAFAFVLFFLVFLGWVFRPAPLREEPAFSDRDVVAAQAARAASRDTKNPPAIHQAVNYATGAEAAWYPKGEAPSLVELVKAELLPAVVERTGPEPAVLAGVEGIGRYGGTWIMATGESVLPRHIQSRLSAASLLRWSPEGFPIVQHVAKGYDIHDGHREFIFYLRKGMRWSDGHPFTADDILYWWESEATDRAIQSRTPEFMRPLGKVGNVERIDDYTVRFRFSEPNGIFLQQMATSFGAEVVGSPAHYLKPFHPRVGDRELIERTSLALNLPGGRALYTKLKAWNNPEHPRLWPWIYRTYKASPPQIFVRNPYYFAVDLEGNQLPYIDRILLKQMTPDMATLAASNGEVSMQWGLRFFYQYTRLMTLRDKNQFEVYHWSNGHGTLFAILPNLNRRIDPSKPASIKKRDLLNKKAFRQALSLALDRQEIIRAEFNGLTIPAQIGPGPDSPYYNASLYRAYTDYDPNRANRLLDGLHLIERDSDGIRVFPDGTPLTLYLVVASTQKPDRVENILDYWAQVGVRVVLRTLSPNLRSVVRNSRDFDLIYTGAHGQILPVLNPHMYIPVSNASFYAIGYGNWYQRGGMSGHPDAFRKGALEPPNDHPLRRAMEIYERAIVTPDLKKQAQVFNAALEIAAENLWSINVSTAPPVIAVVKRGFRGVPEFAMWTSEFQTPGNTGMETYFFERPLDSAGAVAQLQQSLVRVDRFPGMATSHKVEESAGSRFEPKFWLRTLLSISGVLILVYLGVRKPFIGRRLLIMVPTLFAISVVVFFVIQLPPGNFLTSLLAQLEESGEVVDEERIREIEDMFLLDRSGFEQYLHWSGIAWFFTFDGKDKGLLQGNMGRSMETQGPVNALIGDRLLLTFLISFGTILFTWAIALPIGIYGATRQHSIGDYAASVIGFIGMCIPNFLLALLLMYFSSHYLGINVSGLFSAEYSAQPEWSWGKILDLMKHIWIPVLVVGTAGTAGMIRIMRGNLLDELRKPYVTTAKAKGVYPAKLLLKYPVRLALNPFISGIGSIFPQLVSGGSIVAMVLSLPTVGPLLLSALLSEDMYLAGSMLMLLSLLGILGVLVSDLVLMVIDPRIRMESGHE